MSAARPWIIRTWSDLAGWGPWRLASDVAEVIHLQNEWERYDAAPEREARPADQLQRLPAGWTLFDGVMVQWAGAGPAPATWPQKHSFGEKCPACIARGVGSYCLAFPGLVRAVDQRRGHA